MHVSGLAASIGRTLTRPLIVVLIAVCSLLPLHAASPAFALAPRALTGADFYNYQGKFCDGCYGGYNESAAIATEKFATAYGLYFSSFWQNEVASVSVNAVHLRGYNAVTFALGFGDAVDNNNTPGDSGASGHLAITRDGQLYRTIQVAAGQAAQPVTVLFGGHTVIKFTATRTDSGGSDADLLLANPTAVTVGASSAATVSLALSVPAGGSQVINVKTKPHAFVSMIVTFPQGRPLIAGPFTASSTGQWSYSFPVPQGDHGYARVVVVAAGQVLLGGFTIG